MLKGSLIVITGWGHPSSAMAGLCRELTPDIRTVPVSTHDLWVGGNQGTNKDCASLSGRTSPYADALLSLIQEQGKRVSIVGWSMGGLVALEVASRHPEWIDRLALISSTPQFCSGKEFSCGVPVPTIRVMLLGLKRDPGKTLAGFYRLAAAPFPEPVAAIPDQAPGWRTELAAGLNYLMRTDLRGCLERVHLPVLILHGREDRVIPWQAADYANRGLPDSRLRLYDGVGHDLPLREPRRLADDIRLFLS